MNDRVEWMMRVCLWCGSIDPEMERSSYQPTLKTGTVCCNSGVGRVSLSTAVYITERYNATETTWTTLARYVGGQSNFHANHGNMKVASKK